MLKFVEFLKKRPKDNTIRLMRILFWLLIIFLLWLYLTEYKINILPSSMSVQTVMYIKYSLFILWLLPILFGIINPCIAKRKYIKIAQIIFGILLMFLWNNISVLPKWWVVVEIKSNTWTINLEDISNKTKESKPVNVGFYIALIWFLQIIGWISGKCITSKCIKHWETITKIRV